MNIEPKQKVRNWKKYLLLFTGLYGLCILTIWKRYDFNPTCMVNFGKEFALQNPDYTPKGAIVMLGGKNDLGAGYDGQIFYYFSRPLSEFHLRWPKGFDESYRAPRIGYPFLVSIFGIFGMNAAIFGMYFWNLILFFLSFLALREITNHNRLWTLLYLLSPFSLGSFSVLVSDSVMVSLLILSYYFYKKEKYTLFAILGGLAVLTKEPALFFLFPLGLHAVWERSWKKMIAVASTLLFMIAWQMYLKFTFPQWEAGRLTEFIQPLDGITFYLREIYHTFSAPSEIRDFRGIARVLGRFPLLLLFVLGIALLFSGNLRKGWVFRLSMALILFMIGSADYYHFWSVYENISRMFTLSVPVLILWKQEDPSIPASPYAATVLLVLIFFLMKILLVSQPLPYELFDEKVSLLG